MSLPEFQSSYRVNEVSGCWEWAGNTNPKGYGTFHRGGYQLAHRWAYATLKAPIPRGLCVCHTCDNRACVNPDHLWVGTQQENIADMIAKGRDLKYVGPRPWVAKFGDENPSRTHRHRMPRGEQTNTAKLTAGDVLEIRRIGSSVPQTELAARYGVSQVNIGCVLLRKTWKHI